MKNYIDLLIILLCGIFIVIGVMITIVTKNNNKVIKLSAGLTLGMMASLIVCDLIPRAVNIFNDKYNSFMTIILLVSFTGAGVLILKVIRHFTSKIDYFKLDDNEDKKYNFGLLTSLGIIIYNIFVGMYLYKMLLVNFKTGIILIVGIGMHNIPMGMIVTSIFYRLREARKSFMIIISVTTLSTFIGGVLMFILKKQLDNNSLAVLLSVAAGSLIYTVIFELIPYLKRGHQKGYTVLGLASGVIIFILNTILYS